MQTASAEQTPCPERRFSARAAIAFATLLLLAPFVMPEVARASVEDQRREVERIVDELDRLHTQADVLAEDWNEAADQLRELTDEVAKAEESVAAKEAELAGLRGDLSEVALRTLTGSGPDVLGPLFSNADVYSDALRRDQFSRVALSVGTGTTDDLDELIRELEEERADLQSKRQQVETLQATIEQKQQQTEQLTAQYTEQRTAAEARLGRLIEEEEQRRAEEAWRQLQAEVAAQQSAAATASSGGGSTDAGSGGSGSDSATTGAGSGGGGSGGGGSGSGGGGSGSGGSSETSEPSSPPPAVSSLSEIAVQAALSQQGKPYRYATAGPSSYDCSGLTHYSWGRAGVYLPRNSRAQAAATPRVPSGSAQRGDLLFYYSPISHVGIYLGNGSYVHAPATGDVVKVSPVRWHKVTAVGRPG
jgi:cell wall-associated NlpC family hydrolase